MISLIDFKGDPIEIYPCGSYKTSRRGLVESWCYVKQDWNPKYSRLPFPIFTDWWVVPNHLTRAA